MIDNVESVVVWSSASIVTVAPTDRAALAMVRACSSAIRSPSPGSAWPIALSLTLTSERAVSEPRRSVSPALLSPSSSLTYAATTSLACPASVVSSPR